jgi:hypothetical protein
MILVYTVLIVITYCLFIWDILLHEFKELSIINSILKLVFAFLFFVLFIYILPYILVSFKLTFPTLNYQIISFKIITQNAQ